ncbi:MAG: hypothetical protein GY828_05370 [Candidatus Gracilibacteria bacterium]|nr:hypothetical protein [Candidatus Gracilibacteria bacterium]
MSLELKLKYRDVDIDKVLSIPLYGKITSNIYKSIFHNNELKIKTHGGNILIVYTHARSMRNDFLQIIENLYDEIQVLFPTVAFDEPIVSLKEIYKLLLKISESLSLFRILPGGLFRRISLIIMIAATKRNIDNTFSFLEKVKFDILVTFCDAYEKDNIIAQCGNLMKKITVTLQHGNYHISDLDVPENMALKNLVSNYMCAWSEATCDEYSKVNKKNTKLVPLGSLRTVSDFVEYDINELIKNQTNRLICLMLNADNDLDVNVRMIKITNEFCASKNFTYCIRYHPRNKKHFYSQFLNKSFVGEFNLSHNHMMLFSIIYTSGVMIELLSKGQLFFMYQDQNVPQIFRQNVMTFINQHELYDLYKWVYSYKLESVEKMNSMRGYFVSTVDVKMKYLKFFKEIQDEILGKNYDL